MKESNDIEIFDDHIILTRMGHKIKIDRAKYTIINPKSDDIDWYAYVCLYKASREDCTIYLPDKNNFFSIEIDYEKVYSMYDDEQLEKLIDDFLDQDMDLYGYDKKIDNRRTFILKMYRAIPDEIFHVHTYRCKHAENITDDEYIEKAIELGAPRIAFTDHAPFPGNPFGNRMDIEQLPEYINTLSTLKKKYKDKIEVITGLEIEFLPGYMDYYRDLRSELDLLIIGQHFYEHEPGHYSFSDEDKSMEYIGLSKAITQGIMTKLFDVVAHPDRSFRRRKKFGDYEQAVAINMINTVTHYSVYIEKNYSSMHRKKQYWPEFWNLLPSNARIIHGIDAHSIEDIVEGTEFFRNTSDD